MTTPALRDELTGMLIGLVRATEGNEHLTTAGTARILLDGLQATQEPCNEAVIQLQMQRVRQEKRRLVPDCFYCACPCGRTSDFELQLLDREPEGTRSLKLRLLAALRRVAPQANAEDLRQIQLVYRCVYAVGMEDWAEEEILPLLQALSSEFSM